MKLGPIVVSSPGQLGKISAGIGSVLPVQLDHHVAHASREATATELFCSHNNQRIMTYVVSRVTVAGCQLLSGMDMTILWALQDVVDTEAFSLNNLVGEFGSARLVYVCCFPASRQGCQIQGLVT